MTDTTAELAQPPPISCPSTYARHCRYDALGRRTGFVDALGADWTSSYNLAGQTGTGRNTMRTALRYPGGPQTDVPVFDEGERRAVTGGAAPVRYGDDALYRQISILSPN